MWQILIHDGFVACIMVSLIVIFSICIHELSHGLAALEHNFCQHFRPVINETAASLSNQHFSIGIRRPERSKIYLDANQATLEIKVPRKQVDYTFAGKGNPILVGCFTPVILSFLLASIMGMWAFLLGLVLSVIFYKIYLSSLSEDARRYLAFSGTASSTHLVSITFQAEHSIIVTLYNRFAGSDASMLFRKELGSLSAGLSTVPEYRLNLGFRDSSSPLAITGNRQEIQWLCDAVSEWTGIQAERWELPSA